MATTATASIDVLSDVVRERARAEAREVVAMLSFRDAENARIDASGESPMRRLVERGAVALAIAESTGFSEGQIQFRLSTAVRLRREARRPAEPGDERTAARREADLLVAWLLDEEAAAGVVDANIGVTVDACLTMGRAAHHMGPPAVTTSDRCADGTTDTRATASCAGPPSPN